MSKQILLDILSHKPTTRPAWVPFAGIHAGKLIGANAIEQLTDSDKMYQSLMEVNRLYMPDGQPVLFDLQVEAEILGCQLMWVEDSPPTVKTHPLELEATIPTQAMPTGVEGRLPIILDTMRRLKHSIGGDTALYGLVCGPFTLASHLRGTDIFMDMFDDEDYVLQLVDYCKQFIIAECDLYIDAGMDVIAVVDPLVSQISSTHFEEFLSQAFADIFSHIRDRHAYSSFFVCGDATRNIGVMCETHPDSISVDENVDLAVAKGITDSHGVVVGGNIPLTTVMLHGCQQDNMKYVVDLIDSVGGVCDMIVSPGCDMPYAVPVENTIGCAQAVREYQQTKQMLHNYQSTDFSTIDIDMVDYTTLDRPLVEVFTLDSSSCAACTYMMAVANEMKSRYGSAIDVVEYKYTDKTSIARCIKMGVAQLPSLYINGVLYYSSIIPTASQLSQDIDKLLQL